MKFKMMKKSLKFKIHPIGYEKNRHKKTLITGSALDLFKFQTLGKERCKRMK